MVPPPPAETPPSSAPTQPPATYAVTAAFPSPAGESAPALAVTVPGHEVLSELGRGGMGVVYKARQTKLNRLVALKMILAGAHAGAMEKQRFLTEAEAAARLSHPNIVQIHEIGESGGLPYFSLEFCDGGSLADRFKGAPAKPEEAAWLVEQISRAIHHAHEQGVVHRDLKPANVLLDGGDGLPASSRPLTQLTPKIADFGLAKKIGEDGQTISGTILGTPGYMAPEQAGGNSRAIGPATDVYSLGAILYELLTGRPPFRAASPLETVYQVIHNDPVAPSHLQPGLSRDLETVCLKCLQKEPLRRYASALDLADDLRRWQDGEPTRARPVSPVFRLVRWCRRHPAIAGLLLLVAISLLISFVNLRASLASVERLARRNQLLLVESLAGRLDERLRSNTQAISILSRQAEIRALLQADPARRQTLLPGAQAALQSILLANADFSSAFVLSADGVALASTNEAHPGKSYAFRDYYQEAIRGRTFRSKILIGTSTARAGMYYSAPVLGHDGRVLGVVVVKLEAEALWHIVEELDIGENSSTLLVDEDGIIVAHSDRSLLYHSVTPLTEEELRAVQPRNRFQSDTVACADVPALAALYRARAPGSRDYAHDGTRRTLAYAPLRQKPWVVATDLDTRDFAFERSRLLRRALFGLAIVSGIVVVLATAYFVRRMMQPRR